MRAADGIWAGRRDLLLQAYAAYNAQDVEALLARISDDVDWPDGAGRLHGKELRATGPSSGPERALTTSRRASMS